MDTLAGRRSSTDAAMRRLLRIPEGRRDDDQERPASVQHPSMVVSGLRCLVTYIVLPFVAPALGWRRGWVLPSAPSQGWWPSPPT